MGLDKVIKIAIFDGNKNFRNHIVTILNSEQQFKVVGMYSDAKNSVEDLLVSKPDIVLIDIEIPGVIGFETIKRLKKELPHIQILVQSSSEDDAQIYYSILAGASGYILKSQVNNTLTDAIKELGAGGAPLSPSVARRLLNMIKENVDHHSKIKSALHYNLTEREKEVLHCIVKGKNYKMTGYELNISYETVRSHMKNIYEKLNVASLTEVVAKAINYSIV